MDDEKISQKNFMEMVKTRMAKKFNKQPSSTGTYGFAFPDICAHTFETAHSIIQDYCQSEGIVFTNYSDNGNRFKFEISGCDINYIMAIRHNNGIFEMIIM